MLEIALASQSPRRRELLTAARFSFSVFHVKVSEIFDENLNPEQVASHLATVKLLAAVDHHKELKLPGFLVLAADTIVVFGKRILGKPENSSQARDYLHLLSGRTHSVITGIALQKSGSTNLWTGYEETKVEFRPLTDQEIDTYVASGEPMDKAGGYGIQGAAKNFVSKYSGSWSNVVGLPMELLERAVKENGWNVNRR